MAHSAERTRNRLAFAAGATSIVACGLILAQAATAALIFSVARQTGPRSFGAFAALLSGLTLASDVIDFGRNNHALRSLSSKYDAQTVRQLVTDKLEVGAASSIAIVGPVLYVTDMGQWSSAVVLLAWLPMACAASAAQIGLRSQNRSTSFACVTAADRVSALAVFAVLRLLSVGPSLAASLGLLIGATVSTALTLMMLSLRPSRSISRTKDLVDNYRQARHFGAAGLTSDLQLMDVPVLAAVAGPMQAGLFAIPARVTGPLGILPTALTATVMRRATAGFADVRERQQLRMALVKILSIMAGVLFVFAVCAPFFTPRLLGSGYQASVPMLQIYALAMLFASFNQPAAQILQAIGRERYVSRVVGFAAVASLGVVALGGYLGGGLGATAGFTLMQVFIAGAFYPGCRDFLRLAT